MHRLWIEGNKKQKFLHRLNAVSNLDDIKKMLLLFERIIRKPVFSIVWWNCLGHTKLLRATAEERERRQRLEQLKKKDDRVCTLYKIKNKY
jgi:hypothetical protein